MPRVSAATQSRVLKVLPSVGKSQIEDFYGKPTSKLATEFDKSISPVSIDQLKHLIKTSIETKELLLDLEGVRYLLSINKRNRPLSEKRAKHYEEYMKTKRWLRTGETIIISNSSVLNTGQHRLRAAELYGKPVWFNISFGQDAEAFVVTDTGRAHKASDVLSLMGVKNYALVAATLRLLVQYEQGLPQSSTKAVGPALIKEALERYTDIDETTGLFLHYNYPSRGFRTAVLNAVTWLSMNTYGEEKTKEFLITIADGITNNRDDPARQLRERFLRDEKARIGQIERFALSLKAMIAFQEGKTISTLQWRFSGRNPESFPTVPKKK